MTVDAEWRVALAPFDTLIAGDLPTWLAEAWCAIDGLRPGSDAPATPEALQDAIERRWPGAGVGSIDVASRGIGGFIAWESVPGDQPATVIRGLAIRREWRNLGYGAEAVERLEAQRAGNRCWAAVPRSNGLAVYFWLRVGFRPVRGDEDGGRLRDRAHLWMIRAAPEEVSGGIQDP